MQTLISYAELDEVAGELLPERAVMSTMVTPMMGGSAEFGGAANGGPTVVAYACSAGSSPATSANGALGILAATPSVGPACVPGGIITG
ncbi:MAG: hypothetical protein ACRDT8_15960 [Micromonosporaceae bacterium]